jgi:hypothetical protein
LHVDVGRALCQEAPQFFHIPSPGGLVQGIIVLPILVVHYEVAEL